MTVDGVMTISSKVHNSDCNGKQKNVLLRIFARFQMEVFRYGHSLLPQVNVMRPGNLSDL